MSTKETQFCVANPALKPQSPTSKARVTLDDVQCDRLNQGGDWAISVAPDPRITSLHEELRRVKGSDFEVLLAPR